MRRFSIIFFIFFGLLIQGQIWGQDLTSKPPGQYSVAASSENVILLDTHSGETWMLVKKPNLSQPYEWVKIPSPVEQKTGAQDWVSITQGQKKGDVVTGKVDIIKWRENELMLTRQKTAQLQSSITQIEAAQQKINNEISADMINAAKSSMQAAMDQWKMALDIMKDIIEQQQQSINNLGRI